MIRSIAVAMTLALFAAPVFAQEGPVQTATISESHGLVQVNTGDGFLAPRPGQIIQSGDRVMAGEDSEATLKFADGCELEVKEQTIVTLPSRRACDAKMTYLVQSIAPSGTGAVGAGGVDWKGFWTIAGIVMIGDAILFAEDERDTASP